MTHKFKPTLFTEGKYQGQMTCLQQWTCHCGVKTELPMNLNPNDYHNGDCKEVKNVAKTDSNNLHGLQSDIRMRGRDDYGFNKNGVRHLRPD